MSITLLTSGSTDEPKEVTHSWEYIEQCADKSIKEIKLTSEDRVLDVFPGNTIAHYTITAYPAKKAGAHLYTANFNPYRYIEYFKKIQPTYISLISRHLNLLKNTKGFSKLDMRCVRYMVTGSSKIEQEFIDTFKNQGVQTVANWYGMTEYPPPIMIGYNSTKFDLKTVTENIKFHNLNFPLAECIINGKPTGDIFNIDTMEFYSRKINGTNSTWKTSF
jgi:long-subunit acyl-CoA synthetase (AMP-forming)